MDSVRGRLLIFCNHLRWGSAFGLFYAGVSE
jgi:hypothetical protein